MVPYVDRRFGSCKGIIRLAIGLMYHYLIALTIIDKVGWLRRGHEYQGTGIVMR